MFNLNLTDMKAKDNFQLCCLKIADKMEKHGFKSTKRTSILKKYSKNKKLSFEIHFQSSLRNWTGDVYLWVQVCVFSSSLKNWQQKKYGTDCVFLGEVFTTKLENLTPLKEDNYDWNISLENQDLVVESLVELIENYVLPVFEKYENINFILKDYIENGSKLNEYFDPQYENLPIDFLCFFGNNDVAQSAFSNFLLQNKMIENAKRIFRELDESGKSSIYHVTDLTIKKAYFNNLKILF